jgi:hypothetical protein
MNNNYNACGGNGIGKQRQGLDVYIRNSNKPCGALLSSASRSAAASFHCTPHTNAMQ